LAAKIVERTGLRERLKIYRDRVHAAEILANIIEDLIDDDTCLAAIPNGGVPIGVTIADMLDIELGLMMVARLLIPWEGGEGIRRSKLGWNTGDKLG